MLAEVRIPNARELKLQRVLVRRLIGRVGEEIEMPALLVDAAIRSGAVELVKNEPAREVIRKGK